MRLRSLDAVRGIAAVIVLLHHSVAILPGGLEDRALLASQGFGAPMAWLYLTPLRLLVSGPVAVVLFFVLSGLVLSFSTIGFSPAGYLAFVVKRICRIWLPFAMSILIAAALYETYAYPPTPDASPWFDEPHRHILDWDDLLAHLAMFGTAMYLNNPMWSLVVEMRFSLVFPILVQLFKRYGITVFLVSVVLAWACTKLSAALGLDTAAGNLLASFVYLPLFLTGMLIARHFERLTHLVETIPTPWRLALWIAALGGLCFAPQRTDEIVAFRYAALMLLNGVCAGIVLMLCAVPGAVADALMRTLPQYLGRISYSLYLTHMIVLGLGVGLLHPVVPLNLAVAVSAVAAIAVADLFQRWVEGPAIQLGRIGGNLFGQPRSIGPSSA